MRLHNSTRYKTMVQLFLGLVVMEMFQIIPLICVIGFHVSCRCVFYTGHTENAENLYTDKQLIIICHRLTYYRLVPLEKQTQKDVPNVTLKLRAIGNPNKHFWMTVSKYLRFSARLTDRQTFTSGAPCDSLAALSMSECFPACCDRATYVAFSTGAANCLICQQTNSTPPFFHRSTWESFVSYHQQAGNQGINSKYDFIFPSW